MVKLYYYLFDVRRRKIFRTEYEAKKVKDGYVYANPKEDNDEIRIEKKEIDQVHMKPFMEGVFVYSLSDDINRALDIMSNEIDAKINHIMEDMINYQGLHYMLFKKQEQFKNEFGDKKEEL